MTGKSSLNVIVRFKRRDDPAMIGGFSIAAQSYYDYSNRVGRVGMIMTTRQFAARALKVVSIARLTFLASGIRRKEN